jgi:hypothetical protein
MDADEYMLQFDATPDTLLEVRETKVLPCRSCRL